MPTHVRIELDENLEFNGKQARGLLLAAEGLSHRQIAAELKVAVTTVTRWYQNPRWRSQVRELRDHIFDRTISLLAYRSADAVQTLDKLMHSPPDRGGATQLGAAKALLEFCLRARSQEELVERLNSIEKALKEMNSGANAQQDAPKSDALSQEEIMHFFSGASNPEELDEA